MRRYGRVQSTLCQAFAEAFDAHAGFTEKQRTAAGFSLLEMLVVVAIAMVLSAMAIPMTINAMRSYKLNAAVAAATGAIQSTRYAAIMHGYPGTGVPGYGYEITFTPSTNSYQVYAMVPPATTYSAVGTPIPIAPVGDVSISRTVTFQFSAGGTVTETSNNMTFSITNAYGGSNTITVTGVGNVSVASP